MSVQTIRRLTDDESDLVVGIGFTTSIGYPGYVTGVPERPLVAGEVLRGDVRVDMVGAGCFTGRTFSLRVGDTVEQVNSHTTAAVQVA